MRMHHTIEAQSLCAMPHTTHTHNQTASAREHTHAQRSTQIHTANHISNVLTCNRDQLHSQNEMVELITVSNYGYDFFFIFEKLKLLQNI